MRRCAIVLLAAAIAIPLIATLVFADDVRVVVIGPAQSAVVSRMREELELLGLTVELVTKSDPRDLATIARDHRAAAAARVEQAPAEVVVWVDPSAYPGRGAGPSEIRVSESMSGPVEPALLALRTVELLRGRLIPVSAERADSATAAEPTSHAPDAVIPPPSAAPAGGAAAEARAAPHAGAERRLGAFVAPALVASPGGLPPAPLARIGGAWMARPRLGVEALAFLPTTAMNVSAPEGSIGMRLLDVGAGARGVLTAPSARWSATASLGMTAMLLVFEGDASPPWVASGGSRWTAAPYASLGGGVWISPRWAVRAELLAALLAPKPILRVAGQGVASFGQPALLASLGLEVWP